MATRRLTETISPYVVLLFNRRGATVDENLNTIATDTDTVRKTVDRFTERLLIKPGQLTLSD